MSTPPVDRFPGDDHLTAQLADAVAQAQGVPAHRREAARAAFAWLTVDAELLMLSHDSSELAGAAVRGPDQPRTLAFEGGGVTVELEVDDGRVMGQVLASRPSDVALESVDGMVRMTRSDASGFFTLTADATGPVRFSVVVDGETRRTQWVVL